MKYKVKTLANARQCKSQAVTLEQNQLFPQLTRTSVNKINVY